MKDSRDENVNRIRAERSLRIKEIGASLETRRDFKGGGGQKGELLVQFDAPLALGFYRKRVYVKGNATHHWAGPQLEIQDEERDFLVSTFEPTGHVHR